MPIAMASPPPNISTTSHGARLASGQVSIARPVPSGRTNSTSPAIAAIVPSVSPPLGKNPSSHGSATQARNARKTTGIRRRSGTVHCTEWPMAARAETGSKLSVWSFWTRAMIHAANGTAISAIGTPYIAHTRNVILVPSVFSISPAAIALVGVPIIVARPPIDAAKAMPIGSAPAIPEVSPFFTPPAASMASAIGIMISAVDVFEIKLESTAVAAITPNSNCAGRAPAKPMMNSASRLCRPVRSIARARNAPPMNRNMIGE